MKSLFFEGLVAARDLVKEKGLDGLESLIKEHQDGVIETTAVVVEAEKR